MGVTIKTRRLGAGSYDIDTPSGTYQLKNCPVDTGDPFTVGFRRGPRWMLTNPGAYSADNSFDTKRDAIESIRANEQRKADQAATQTHKETAVTATTDFKPGQRIIVANGTTQTVVKMADRIGNEPQRVEVEGGLQWLAANCELAPEQSAPTLCSHGRSDQRGELADRVTIPLRICEPGVTYGLWDDYAGGFTYAGDCAHEVATEGADRLTNTENDSYDPDGEFKVLAVCREHDDEPADTCEQHDDEDED